MASEELAVSPPETMRAAERSDVRRNRAALLVAAREMLNENPETPLYAIAASANVGQATLYRHFPDRSALAAAVSEQVFDDIEDEVSRIDTDSPDSLFRVVEQFCKQSIEDGNLYTLLPKAADGRDHVSLLRDRMASMIAAPLEAARRAGVVRTDVTMADVLLVIRMVTSAIRATNEAPVERTRVQVCERSLRLVWGGIAGVGSTMPTPAK